MNTINGGNFLRETSFKKFLSLIVVILLLCVSAVAYAGEQSLDALDALIAEALKNSPEISRAESVARAARHRAPQSRSLPDPMFMIGYQNEGFKKINYGESMDAQIMYGVSQMVPFPGKRRLKGEMAEKDALAASASVEQVRLQTVERVKEFYYGLFLTHKETEIIEDFRGLFTALEEASLARYSSGMGTESEVLMAQREKYMLIERAEMAKQKSITLEAMLLSAIGRAGGVIDEPLEPRGRSLGAVPSFTLGAVPPLDDILNRVEDAPMLREKALMLTSEEKRLDMQRREYYPDITLGANYFQRGNEFEDMWSVTATFNVPLFYAKRQREAVNESSTTVAASEAELRATRLMIEASLRETYQMAQTSETLMTLYKTAMIPKARQDFEAAISSYRTGKVEAMTTIASLKGLLDAEFFYWQSFVEREKAIAKIEGVIGPLQSGGSRTPAIKMPGGRTDVEGAEKYEK